MPDFAAWIQTLLDLLALPQIGLSSVFIISLVSATLLPMGSEPAVYGLITLRPELFWPTIFVATLGNTLGGMIDYWMGYGAHQAYERAQAHAHPHDGAGQPEGRTHNKALAWLERFGAKACLLAWLPVIGDPLCSVAGWLRLPFWPCVVYMAIGKFLRYLVMTGGLIWATWDLDVIKALGG